MVTRLVPLVALAGLAAGAACQDSIAKGWLVDRPRVIAARVEAAADPGRASLGPSEHARVTWLLASPRGTPHFGWVYAACASPIGATAAPACDGPTLASGAGAADGELVATDLDTPAAAALGSATELLVLAAFCAAGTPALDARAFTATCSGGGDPLLASLRVRLATAGANTNPSAPEGVRLGDAPLVPSDVPAGSTCDAAPELPRVPAGSSSDLVYAFRAEDREATESLVLSLMVTAGELDHEYSALDADEALPKEIRVPWTAPRADATQGAASVVRFFLVLRDGRGGAAFSRFSVCVTPAP